MFQLQPNGFANKDLRTLTADLRAFPAEQVTASQITYDLRRLRARGLIARVPALTDTPSPTGACTPRCSSPLCTTASCRQARRTSPTTPPPHHCAQLPGHIEQPSKLSATQQESPHNTTNRTRQHKS